MKDRILNCMSLGAIGTVMLLSGYGAVGGFDNDPHPVKTALMELQAPSARYAPMIAVDTEHAEAKIRKIDVVLEKHTKAPLQIALR